MAYLILSTCLGDTVRARMRSANYGRTYGRNMSYMAQGEGGREQMEMQEMVGRGEGDEVEEEEEEGGDRDGLGGRDWEGGREGGIELRGDG